MIKELAKEIHIAKCEKNPEKKLIQLKKVRRKLIETIVAKNTSENEKNKAYHLLKNDLMLFMN